ncbi:hypothetical protein [Tomitella gaofuii]|uniref:hypothetical protein n=1 Tax=Tomitella gaofuii TaxID=2760083 RepID=UPI0015FC4755|nr:hypothetical protein [Tomitella gaofuii]
MNTPRKPRTSTRIHGAPPTRRVRRGLQAGVTALGVTATALVLTAPNASAHVQSLSVAPGMGFGSLGAGPYGTGCAYDVTAQAEHGNEVDFFDNGVYIGSAWAPGSLGPVTISWTPASAGTHVLVADDGFQSATQTVEVGNGVNLGSVCLVLP